MWTGISARIDLRMLSCKKLSNDLFDGNSKRSSCEINTPDDSYDVAFSVCKVFVYKSVIYFPQILHKSNFNEFGSVVMGIVISPFGTAQLKI